MAKLNTPNTGRVTVKIKQEMQTETHRLDTGARKKQTWKRIIAEETKG